MKVSPNSLALVKIAASVYDMYDHAHYAERHNDNNPSPREGQDVFVVNNAKDVQSKNVSQPKFIERTALNLPKVPYNQDAPAWSKEQTHIYPSQITVQGTGHGKPYGPTPENPFRNA